MAPAAPLICIGQAMTDKSKEPVDAGSSQRALDNGKVTSYIYYSKFKGEKRIENEKALPVRQAFSKTRGAYSVSLARKPADIKQAEAPCLSNVHICTRENEKYSPSIEFYSEGSAAIVSREKVEKYCGLCGAAFVAPAWKAERLPLCGSCRQQAKSTRGSIETFSRRSRRRLMFLANTVRGDVKPLFATATFADSFPHFEDPKQWKEALRVFAARFTRRFNNGSFIWRLEIVDRKSGLYTGKPLPHFHFIVFGVSILEFRAFFVKAWHEIAGYQDPKHLAVTAHWKSVTVMESKRRLVGYVSKAVGRVMAPEVSKDIQAKGFNVGRWWGVVARGLFSFFQSVKTVMKITERQAVELIRCFRKYAHIKGRALSTFTVFINGVFLGERLPDLLALGN